MRKKRRWAGFLEAEGNAQDKNTSTCRIKTLKSKHLCDDCFDNPRAGYKTLALYFKKHVQNNPKYAVKDMRGQLENNFQVNMSKSKLKRAKRLALERLEGSFRDEYNKLEAFGQEIRYINPGTDFVINLSKNALEEEKKRFLRMYTCFQALKESWKNGLRPLIGLDGTFLKGKCKGQLLVAIGQDCMNHFYPLAWVVVDKENSRTWQWFMEHLKLSLDLKTGSNVTFISDMQKGLLDVVRTILPDAHHRFCVRHIIANWMKKWRSGKMKKLLWWCAWSTYEEEFEDQLKKLGELDEEAAKDLLKYPPQAWCKAYFDTKCKNEMVDNNVTESFNSWILEARHKPIIIILEDIRVKVMNMIIANVCKVVFNGDHGYEISEGDDRHTAMNHKKVGPLTGVNWWHSRDAYVLTYKHKLQPIRGLKFWKVDPAQAMEPP
nr:uncharacterized protein LOC117281304 [Nicotiana tomentosiformis]